LCSFHLYVIMSNNEFYNVSGFNFSCHLKLFSDVCIRSRDVRCPPNLIRQVVYREDLHGKK
jgi:hypothetical protein